MPKALDVYKAVPWQLQAFAVLAGIAVYVGYKAVKKIETGISAIADAPGEIITGAQTFVRNELDAEELRLIRLAQYGSAFDLFDPRVFAFWTVMQTQGYIIARTGEVFRIPPK